VSRQPHHAPPATEIHDGNSKPLLGLMWTLVHEFQLQASDEETGKSTGPSDALVLSRPPTCPPFGTALPVVGGGVPLTQGVTLVGRPEGVARE
jgi:hypothetical protein